MSDSSLTDDPTPIARPEVSEGGLEDLDYLNYDSDLDEGLY